MKRSRLRTLVLSATLAVAGVGCYDVFGIVPDYFSLRIIPPEPGGGYAAVPGGEIIATLRVQNGLRVRTDIKFVVSTPPHVTARVEGSNDTESVPDLELGPEEARDLDVVINVGPDQPEGPFTVEISAEGESVLATNPDGRSYMDVQTAQVEVQVITDELPPTVTIHDPAPNSIFTRLPIQVSATASDDGSVTSVSSTLNGGPPRELFPERSSDAPRPSIDVEFGIPERYDSGTFLDFGRNVLDVQARDASGLTGSAQVEFTYAPTGLCTNLEIVPQRSSFTAAPGDTVGIKVRVAPVGGWSDPVDVRARLPGFATGSIPVRINDLQEPAEVLVKAGLSEDIAPGGDYHVFVWAEDVGSRDIVCEAAIPLTVVAPGVGAPPSVTIDSPPTGLVTADRNLALSATVTDDANLSEFSTSTGPTTPAITSMSEPASSPRRFHLPRRSRWWRARTTSGYLRSTWRGATTCRTSG